MAFEHKSTPLVLLSGARAAYIGPGLNLAPHKNAVATVAIGLDQSFDLKLFGAEPTDFAAHRIAVIAPQTRHHLKANSAMIFLYLDPYSDDYAAIERSALDSTATTQALRSCVNSIPQSDAAKIIAALCGAIGLPERRRPSKQLALALQAIEREPQHISTIKQAAELACLSPSRFQHVFRAELGVPFRRYRLWRRMALVANDMRAGKSLTTAAHEAGFASSAHLSTAFKAMFGIRPSDLLALRIRIEGPIR